MSSELKLRRGSTAAHSTFTGADGEVTLDTDKNVVVSHDGITLGGFPHTKAVDLAASSGASLVGYLPAGTGAVATTVGTELHYLHALTVSVTDPLFGATGNGVTNDYASFMAAHNFVASRGGGTVVASNPSVAWKITGRLDWDTNKVGLIGSGVIDGSSLASGSLFYFPQSEGNVNKRPALNKSHPISGFTYKGPGKAVAGVRCFVVEDLTASQVCAGVTVRDGGAYDWDDILYIGQGGFFTTFENFDFGSVSGGAGSCVVIPTTANSGERTRFLGCRFGIADLYLDQSNGNASTFFEGCSFNYAPTRMVYVGGGSAVFSDGHIESNTDADYWFYVAGANSTLTVSNSAIIVSGNKANYPEFYSHSDCTQGGVTVENCLYGNSSAHTVPLIGGTGKAIAKNISAYSGGAHPVVGDGANLLAYGDFEVAGFANEWALSGTTPPALSAAQSHTGGFSLRFAGIAGQNNAAIANVPCLPGQRLAIAYWAMLEGYGVGGNFYATVSYLDKSGSAIGASPEVMNITGNAAWTQVMPNLVTYAPPGTRSAQLAISFFGVASGTPFGYIDGAILNVS
jgi:hypothetical protein